jgi:glycosyltransferase involved in cell wall biosynthesis
MKFCFFGNVSNSLKGQTTGGAELQIALLAKALALKGHEIIIIDPYSNESFITAEGVKLINVQGWDKGVRGIRLFQYRIPALYKLLKEQKADYYYVRMRSYLHFLSYRAAKKTGGKFIIGLAHDLDVSGFQEKFKYEYKPKFNLGLFLSLWLPNDLVFNYLLKKSDFITLQHSGQLSASLAKRGKAAIFPNIFGFNYIPPINNSIGGYYIHVGSMTILKGTANLYELVMGVDGNSKVVIVGQPCDAKSEKIYEKLKNIKNVVLKGRLGHSETLQLIANAKALISTSNYEGFPNIFLEAWAAGVPVISLKVNPGNVINKYGLGICCDGDLNKMKECIELDKTARIDKKQLISYVSTYHDFDKASERFLSILKKDLAY